jgi:5,10-methylenetetrahydromethanopterin reductase
MTVKFSIDLAGMFEVNDYVRFARMAEDYDFDEVHVVDDLTFKPVWPLLTLIAANTRRIKLGPWLIAPRIVHPAYHAANLAVIDLISNGRAVCALGRGGFFEFLGLDAPEKPLTMVREALQMIRRVLAGDRTPFNGQVFRATGELALRFEPLRKEIPILIGTFGLKTCEMAGTIADGFLTSCMTDAGYFRLLKERFEAGARTAQRDMAGMELAVSPVCCLSRDREAAYKPLRHMLPEMLRFLRPMTEYAGISEATINDATAAALAGDHNKASGYITDDMIRFFATVGTPADIIPQVEGLIDAGANHIAFGGMLGPDPAEAIKLLATEVLPRFR